ncbi:MAG TPA: YciI family protein [Flavobacterium lutivivi]|nr:YciI family protein [Flavobacterium lutivivi]
MKNIFLLFFILLASIAFAQQENAYDEKLAKELGADDYGMKTYVFCILKTGSNTTATPEEQSKLFKGHMDNIIKLSNEGKLSVAGPFMKNDKNYRGIFIFNVSTIEEAKILVESDPAVQAKIFEAELTLWYSSAALQEVGKIHEKISKNKF